MIPPGIAICGVHSVLIGDDKESLSFYLDLSDGSTAAAYVSLADLRQHAHVIEPPQYAPVDAALH